MKFSSNLPIITFPIKSEFRKIYELDFKIVGGRSFETKKKLCEKEIKEIIENLDSKNIYICRETL